MGRRIQIAPSGTDLQFFCRIMNTLTVCTLLLVALGEFNAVRALRNTVTVLGYKATLVQIVINVHYFQLLYV